MTVPITDFNLAKEFIQSESGILLDSSKLYLVENRLYPLCQAHSFNSIGELIEKAKGNHRIKQQVIDAISTNETYFFRDIKPFDLLKNFIVPGILENQNRCVIWSAACSFGQEAYSIAMALKEVLFDLTKYNLKIVGTDISADAVKRANYGVYNSFELARGLTEKQRERYFTQTALNGEFRIDDEIRSVAQFQQQNLLTSPVLAGMYDIVMCRNVAIYFSERDKRILFERIHKALRPGGYLIVGSTESIFDMSDLFMREMYHGAVFYIKK